MSEIAAKDGTAVALRPYERFVKSLQDRAQDNGGNRSFEVGAAQMDKILTAETEDEIWDADEGGVVAAKDFTDVEIEIRDYTLAPSSDQYESDLGVYVNIDAVVLQETRGFSIGEAVIINTGAKLIVTKLERFKAEGHLPVKAVIKGYMTQNGWEVLKLTRAAKRTTPTA